MTNFEKYQDKLTTCKFALSYIDNDVIDCNKGNCDLCFFNKFTKPCDVWRMEWLKAEYVGLTALEKLITITYEQADEKGVQMFDIDCKNPITVRDFVNAVLLNKTTFGKISLAYSPIRPNIERLYYKGEIGEDNMFSEGVLNAQVITGAGYRHNDSISYELWIKL